MSDAMADGAPFDRREERKRRLATVLNRCLHVGDVEVPIALAREVLAVLPEAHEIDELDDELASINSAILELTQQAREVGHAHEVHHPAGTTLDEALRTELLYVLDGARPVGPSHHAGYRAGYAAFEDRMRAHLTDLSPAMAAGRRPEPSDAGGEPDCAVSAPRTERRWSWEDLDAPGRRRDRENRVTSVLNRFASYTGVRNHSPVAAHVVAALPELETIEAARAHVDGRRAEEQRLRDQLVARRAEVGLGPAEVAWRARLAFELRTVADFVAGSSVGVGDDFAAGFDAACRRIARTLRERAQIIEV